MGFWQNLFPYTDFHALNLDWIIAKVKELSSRIDNIKAVLYSPQNLNDEEKAQARANIDAKNLLEVAEIVDERAVLFKKQQALSDEQKLLARQNINATTLLDASKYAKSYTDGNAVQYTTSQNLNENYKQMARRNIGAGTGDVKTVNGKAPDENGNVVVSGGGGGPSDAVTYSAQSGYTDLQREQACQNIGAVTFLADMVIDENEKKIARNNIGAGTGDVKTVNGSSPDANGNVIVSGGSTEGAVLYNQAQSLEEAQKLQARQNIDAPSTTYVNDNFVGSYSGQVLSTEQKKNARENIDAASNAEVVNAINSRAVQYLAQTLTDTQKAQARTNIGAGTGDVKTVNGHAPSENGNILLPLDGAVLYNQAQTLSDVQQNRALTNIGSAIVSVYNERKKTTTNTITITNRKLTHGLNYISAEIYYGGGANKQLTTIGLHAGEDDAPYYFGYVETPATNKNAMSVQGFYYNRDAADKTLKIIFTGAIDTNNTYYNLFIMHIKNVTVTVDYNE